MSEPTANAAIERHIFLCATPTKPKCHVDGTGAECLD